MQIAFKGADKSGNNLKFTHSMCWKNTAHNYSHNVYAETDIVNITNFFKRILLLILLLWCFLLFISGCDAVCVHNFVVLYSIVI